MNQNGAADSEHAVVLERYARAASLDQTATPWNWHVFNLKRPLVARDRRGSPLQTAANACRDSAITRATAPLQSARRFLRGLLYTPPRFAVSQTWHALRRRSLTPIREWRAAHIITRSGLFDRDWYLETYPDVAAKGIDPVFHYVIFGAWEGRRPHPLFDPAFYLMENPEVARAGANPLVHYVEHGQRQGRTPSRRLNYDDWNAVTNAEIRCLKRPSARSEVALFVTYAPRGKLKPHVPHYLGSLKRQGIAVILIVGTDTSFTIDEDLADTMDGIFVRRNEGYDFAAWAHILHLHPELYDAQILYLLNDSLFGPTNYVSFHKVLTKVRISSADLVGLTESYEHGWHIQSYFLALKPRALSSVALHKFLNGIVSYRKEDKEFREYEVRFAPAMKVAGLTCETIFPSKNDKTDRTIFHWKDLLKSGFPFIKVITTLGSFPGVDTSEWRESLVEQGYDVSLAKGTLDEANSSATPSTRSATLASAIPISSASAHIASGSLKVAFIGPWNYDNGLAVASRGYISALRRTGFSLNLHPIRRPFHIHHQVAPAVDLCDFSGDADVAVVHINPDGWPGLLTKSQKEIIRRARARVGLWVWEMTELPENWYPWLDKVNAIWAPSHYCARVCAKKVSVPIDVVPHVVTVEHAPPDPVSAAATRRALGLADQDRAILYAFDGSSYLVRKNPFALVRAFVKSGLAKKGWKLVLKAKHLYDSLKEGKSLLRQINGSSGVLLIDRTVSRGTMGELMRAADIYASPHCAEGFGLTIAEAMAMGKIVVATNYSGNCDYLDATCGVPVDYQLRTLEDDHGHYTRGRAWAQIDEPHLTESLIYAADLVIAGDTRLQNAARTRISNLLSPQAVGTRMRQSLSRLLVES